MARFHVFRVRSAVTRTTLKKNLYRSDKKKILGSVGFFCFGLFFSLCHTWMKCVAFHINNLGPRTVALAQITVKMYPKNITRKNNAKEIISPFLSAHYKGLFENILNYQNS